MYKVLIADDEKIIRMGLTRIVDWSAFGFEIAGEAANGSEALAMIEEKKPDLVMFDIRMPKLHGLDALKEAREKGFTGKVIILSGYSDFSYAQTAISHGILSYLTKPVDVEALSAALIKAKKQLDEERAMIALDTLFAEKAKKTLLTDYLNGTIPAEDVDFSRLDLNRESFRVLCFEKYREEDPLSYSFSDLLRVTNQNGNAYEELFIDGIGVILLKGAHPVEKFQTLLSHYEQEIYPPPEKHSPLDSLFIACGSIVNSPAELPASYAVARSLIDHRFFCDKHQHIMTDDRIPREEPGARPVKDRLTEISDSFVNHIQAFNRNKIAEELKSLENTLYHAPLSVREEKDFLVDLYLRIKERLILLYSSREISFAENSEAISFLMRSRYLYEIVLFLSEQFDRIMTSIGYSSRDSIIDDVVHYIDHNYKENITLENIAPLFGYNSSYLGKIFNRRMGTNFNTYLDKLRIEHAREILSTTKLQVYKVAEMVGYRNVDYFHIKFKKYEGMSPAEFRKKG